jgi:hypothetical protein
MLDLPFFAELASARRILLAGAGGGYDVFCALPIYFGLRDAGKQVFLSSLSFSNLGHVKDRITPALARVTADADGSRYYFPERYLCEWFRQRGEEVCVYCFERTGVKPQRAGYLRLVEKLQLDTIVLVDGGTDSLMRGDEVGLGTPHEDVASIAAVEDLAVERKMLACLGFGIDYFHGVCHAHFLEAVAELTRQGASLGTFSLLPDMPEVKLYQEAARAVFEAMPGHVSIVSSSILSAIEGHYGDFHATDRTAGSTLWINPLMSLYWCFRLAPVARRILYLTEMKDTQTYLDVDDVIQSNRARQTAVRPWVDIPV